MNLCIRNTFHDLAVLYGVQWKQAHHDEKHLLLALVCGTHSCDQSACFFYYFTRNFLQGITWSWITLVFITNRLCLEDIPEMYLLLYLCRPFFVFYCNTFILLFKQINWYVIDILSPLRKRFERLSPLNWSAFHVLMNVFIKSEENIKIMINRRLIKLKKTLRSLDQNQCDGERIIHNVRKFENLPFCIEKRL